MGLVAGVPERRFLAVPETAEWASVRVISGAMPSGPHSVILHVVPSARGDVPNTAVQVKRFLSLRDHSEESVQLPKLKPGATLELCMQLSWLANPEPVEVDVEVTWHSYGFRGGAVASDRPLRIGAASAFARLEVGAPLRSERVYPKAELTAVQRAVRPTAHNISAASAELDYLPPSDAQRAATADGAVGTQLHQMVVTYSFEVGTDKSDELLSVVPRVESLHEQLYDSPLDSSLWRLSDTHGRVLGHGGLIHDSSALKLRKGSYTVELLLRHPSPAQLGALKDLPLLLHITLPSAQECKVYAGRGAASMGGFGDGTKPMADTWLRRGAHRSLYVSAPSAALPSWITPGDVLVGELLIDRNARPSATPLVYEPPPHPATKPADKGGGAAADATMGGAAAEEDDEAAKAAEALEEDAKALNTALLDAKLARLSALRTSGASAARYEALSDTLMADHREHLPLLLELLAYQRSKAANVGTDATADKAGADATAAANAVGSACAALLAPDGPIDPVALAQYWGVAPVDDDESSEAAKEAKKEMEARRKALRLSLYAKAASLAPPGSPADLVTPAPAPTDSAADDEAFIAAVKEMRRWVTRADDLEEAERDGHARTLAKYELASGRPGAALAALHARLKAKPSKPLAQDCIALYEALGWPHWVRHAEEKRERDYPREGLPL